MKKCISIIIMVALLLSTCYIGVYADGTNQFSNTLENEEQIWEEVIAQYQNDPQYMLMNADDEEKAQEMLARIVAAKLRKQNTIVPFGGAGNETYCTVTAIRQKMDNWCSLATILQTLSGMSLLGSVSGSTNDAKQQTLYNSFGNQLPLVYQVTNKLNTYVSSNQYSYYAGGNMTKTSFTDNVQFSLMVNRPVLLHAYTGVLSYYNNVNFGHYLSVDYCNLTTQKMRIKDCHYNSTYFGSHTENIQNVFQSIATTSQGEARYLICA